MRRPKIWKWVGWALLAAGLFCLAIFGLTQLWNWVMPAAFGLKVIDWPLALGLFVLARVLVGFPGGGGRGRGWGKGRHGGAHRGGPEGWGGGPERWGQYREFWKDEGQAAFEAYLARKKGEETTKV